jgi:hypothetical protein
MVMQTWKLLDHSEDDVSFQGCGAAALCAIASGDEIFLRFKAFSTCSGTREDFENDSIHAGL